MSVKADHLFVPKGETFIGGTITTSGLAQMDIMPSQSINPRRYVNLGLRPGYIWGADDLRELAAALNRVADALPN